MYPGRGVDDSDQVKLDAPGVQALQWAGPVTQLAKLGVHTRVEAAAIAHRLGLD